MICERLSANQPWRVTLPDAELDGFVDVLARRIASFKRLVRNATGTPLAEGLALERNLFLKLCVSESALARMRSYEEKKITSPSRSIEV